MINNLLIIFISLFAFVFAQESEFDRMVREQDEIFMSEMEEMDRIFQLYQDQQDSLWDEYVTNVKQKWPEFKGSTKESWVGYSDDLTSRFEVNFKEGFIDIETIVSEEEADLITAGEDEMVDLFRDMFEKRDAESRRLLENQIFNRQTGSALEEIELDEFLDEFKNEIKEVSLSYDAPDGIERRKFEARIPMVSSHLDLRVKRVLNDVKKYCKQYGLDVPLVLSLIHQESYFDPYAYHRESRACGLMQLIAAYGGRDAYRFVYNRDRLVTRDYLNNPSNNIQLGTAYLHLLANREFLHVSDPVKKQYLVLTAYNWGPGSVKRNILQGIDIDKISRKDLFNRIQRIAPKETRNYLKKVTSRMSLYQQYG